MTSVTLAPFGRQAMLSLIEGDIAGASDLAGIPFSEFFASDEIVWLWRIREQQIAQEGEAEKWVANAVIDDESGRPVGHAAFHGPPDGDGLVEVNYTIDPQWRGQGFAKASITALVARAASDPNVVTVRASISPDNAASLAVIASAGFHASGEQWDDEDGLELIFERPAR